MPSVEAAEQEPVVLILPAMYPEQRELLMAGYRNPKLQYLVGAFGTKCGKSYGASILVVKFAWENPDTVTWWIAPVYAQAEEIGKKYITKLLPKGMWKESEKGKKITILNPDGSDRSEIWFKSADEEDNLRGYRVHLIIADEMARISEAAYESFRTTVTKTRGKIVFLSTPKGHNLFYDFFQRGDKSLLGKDEVDPFPEWFSMRLPTSANPYPSPEEVAESVEDARRNLPFQTFQQEYLAEFLSNASQVFGTYKDCKHGEWSGRGEGPGSSRYGVGLDLGRSHDYTVLTVMDLNQRRVVDFKRFNQIDWQLQYAEITAMCRRYNNAILIMDATSAGDPIYNTLMNAGLNVIPYRIYTNTAKRELIDNLRVHIEQRKITYPNIPELMRELEDYEINITPTGVITYSAPRGRHKHDDCVPKGTLIRTSKGPLPIESVVVGDEVLTHLGRYKKVLKTGNRFSDIIYQVKSTGKLPLLLTSNHKMYASKRFTNWSKDNTLDYIDPNWVSVDDGFDLTNYGVSYPINQEEKDVEYLDLLPFCPKGYRVEDGFLSSYVRTNNKHKETWRINCKFNKIPRFVKVDHNLCQMLGYFIAEGSCGTHNVSFASHVKEKPIREWLETYLRSLGFKPSVITTSDNGAVLSVGSVVLKNFFSGFLKADEKKLPNWTESLPISKQKHILLGYFLGDGCFSGGKLSANTISPFIAFQIYEMLLRMNLVAGIRRISGKRTYFKHRDTYSECKEQFVLSVDCPNTATFLRSLNYNKELLLCKTTKEVFIDKIQTQSKIINNFIIGKIRQVECLTHNDLVYNLEVEDDNSYVANGVIVHNCVISLALVTMLVNRPEQVYIYANERGI